MSGTAIRRFTAVMFKNSSNNCYSIKCLNKKKIVDKQIYIYIYIYINVISLRETTAMTIESILSRV